MRNATIQRKTKETDITIEINLDGTGKFENKSKDFTEGFTFLSHMIENFSKHSLIDIKIESTGDLQHHIVEDVAICLAQGLKKALGNKKGIKRFGFAFAPMDEVLARVVIDLSGRGYSSIDLGLKLDEIDGLPVSLLNHFLTTLVKDSEIALHGKVLYGEDDHHKVEGFFKALALAVKQAVSIDERIKNVIPSTKGTI
ncbi:MAG: imidazoleglycerol-phosphate dehydratase [Candidatus Helarchaeota archaeon]